MSYPIFSYLVFVDCELQCIVLFDVFLQSLLTFLLLFKQFRCLGCLLFRPRKVKEIVNMPKLPASKQVLARLFDLNSNFLFLFLIIDQ